ncbi:uncharacterized protein J5M81_008355 isoform 1-T1 [Pluvialis apricaria]
MTSRPARPGDAATAAPAVQNRPDPTRPTALGAPDMTASSQSGMPWEGLGRLHLSKERSQQVEKRLLKPVSSFLQLATTCPDFSSDISKFLQEGPKLLHRWPQRGGGFGS